MAALDETKQNETNEYEIREFIIACDTGNIALVNTFLSTNKSMVNAELPYCDLNCSL